MPVLGTEIKRTFRHCHATDDVNTRSLGNIYISSQELFSHNVVPSRTAKDAGKVLIISIIIITIIFCFHYHYY